MFRLHTFYFDGNDSKFYNVCNYIEMATSEGLVLCAWF